MGVIAIAEWLFLITGRHSGPRETNALAVALILLLYLSSSLSKHRVPHSMNREQAAAWEVVRVNGKREYIRVELSKRLRALFLIAIFFLVTDLLMYLVGGVSYSAGGIIVSLFACMAPVIAMYILIAEGRWQGNENMYQTLVGTNQEQHPLDRSPPIPLS